MLAVPACWWYRYDALNQSWIIVGPPSVRLAHSRDYVLNGIYYSVLEPRQCAKHNVACQHSQKTRDVESMLVQCWPTILVVHTAGGEYKPTPTQCLLNVGPASSVLASIHSALVCHAGATGMLAVPV